MPLSCSFRQGLKANAFQFTWNGIVNLPRGTRFDGGDLIQQFPNLLGLERPPSDEQLVQHNTQAENVRAAVNPVSLAASLLRTHVGWRSRQLRLLAEVRFLQCQSKIGQ